MRIVYSILGFLRRTFLISTVFVLLAGGIVYLVQHPPSFSPSVTCYRCNVILISIDTLGASHTSVYNRSLDTTPYLQSLADRRGVVFAHAYTNAPWTLPSHTALFTGNYPWVAGMMTDTNELSPTIPTIFTTLAGHGYDTAGFSDGPFVQPMSGLTRGITDMHGSMAYSDWNDLPRLFTDSAAWLTSRTSTKPFVLLLRPFEVHDPYGVPNTAGAITIHDIVQANAKPTGPTAENIATFTSAYHQEIRLTDGALQSFMTAFDASPYAKNTIIIITADHGEEMGEHGSAGMHGFSVYNEVIHVPLIFIIPGVRPAVLNQTVELRSIPNTILDLVGSGLNTPLPGSSLLPMIEGKPTPNQIIVTGTNNKKSISLMVLEKAEELTGDPHVIYEPKVVAGTQHVPNLTSVINGKWHLIRNTDLTYELYDLSTDSLEQHNVYGEIEKLSEEDKALIGRMTSLVSTHE